MAELRRNGGDCVNGYIKALNPIRSSLCISPQKRTHVLSPRLHTEPSNLYHGKNGLVLAGAAVLKPKAPNSKLPPATSADFSNISWAQGDPLSWPSPSRRLTALFGGYRGDWGSLEVLADLLWAPCALYLRRPAMALPNAILGNPVRKTDIDNPGA